MREAGAKNMYGWFRSRVAHPKRAIVESEPSGSAPKAVAHTALGMVSAPLVRIR